MDNYKNNKIVRQQLVGIWEICSDMKLGHSVIDPDYNSDIKWNYTFFQDGSYTHQYHKSQTQRIEPIKKGTWAFDNDSLYLYEDQRETPSGILKAITQGIRSINQDRLVMEGQGIKKFPTGYSKSYNYFIHFIKLTD